ARHNLRPARELPGKERLKEFRRYFRFVTHSLNSPRGQAGSPGRRLIESVERGRFEPPALDLAHALARLGESPQEHRDELLEEAGAILRACRGQLHEAPPVPAKHAKFPPCPR